MSDEADILDLKPRIDAQRRRKCPHRHVVVDLEVAELTCSDCDAQLDPWKYLRDLARNEQDERVHARKMRVRMRQATVAYQKHVERLNEHLARLNADIAHLTDVKNRLANEYWAPTATFTSETKTLGTIAAGKRRRKIATGNTPPGT